MTRSYRNVMLNLMEYGYSGAAVAAGGVIDQVVADGNAEWFTNKYGYPRLRITTAGRTVVEAIWAREHSRLPYTSSSMHALTRIET